MKKIQLVTLKSITIRNGMDPHWLSSLDPDPNLCPHLDKKLDPDLHNTAFYEFLI